LRINALGLFSCPETSEKFRLIGDHIAVLLQERRICSTRRRSYCMGYTSSRRTQRSRRSSAGDTRTRLNDGKGSTCSVRKGRLTCWRLRLHIRRTSQDDQFGTYPATTLAPRPQECRSRSPTGSRAVSTQRSAQWRKRNENAKRDDAASPDAGLPQTTSFEDVAREWYAKTRAELG
jgi:hypothetical protein